MLARLWCCTAPQGQEGEQNDGEYRPSVVPGLLPLPPLPLPPPVVRASIDAAVGTHNFEQQKQQAQLPSQLQPPPRPPHPQQPIAEIAEVAPIISIQPRIDPVIGAADFKFVVPAEIKGPITSRKRAKSRLFHKSGQEGFANKLYDVSCRHRLVAIYGGKEHHVRAALETIVSKYGVSQSVMYYPLGHRQNLSTCSILAFTTHNDPSMGFTA